jgi:hypothetical protein
VPVCWKYATTLKESGDGYVSEGDKCRKKWGNKTKTGEQIDIEKAEAVCL